MNKRFRCKLRIVAVLALLAGGTVTATALEQPAGSRPSLFGHGFTESVDVPSPFVRSFIRNRLGAGKAFDVATPAIDVGGQPIGGSEGDLLFAILDFEYQYAIKPWIALRGRGIGFGRFGSDTRSLLAQGITMSTGFEFGWLVRLHERERTALSLDLSLAQRSFTDINLARYIDEIIAGDPAILVRKTPTMRGGAGLRFAWAASPLLGVTVNGNLGNGESVDRTQSDNLFWGLAGAVDFDLRTKTSLPMSVALGQSYATFPEFGDDVVDGAYVTFVRLSYLGREDFLMSLDVSYEHLPLADDKPALNGATFTINLRYYI